MANRKIKERLLADLGMSDMEIEVSDYLDAEVAKSSVDNEKKIDFSQWSVMGDGSYMAAPKAEKQLPSGLYEFE